MNDRVAALRAVYDQGTMERLAADWDQADKDYRRDASAPGLQAWWRRDRLHEARIARDQADLLTEAARLGSTCTVNLHQPLTSEVRIGYAWPVQIERIKKDSGTA